MEDKLYKPNIIFETLIKVNGQLNYKLSFKFSGSRDKEQWIKPRAEILVERDNKGVAWGCMGGRRGGLW